MVDGTIFSIRVIMNFELERELLGFGPKLKVLGPRILVKQMKDLLRKSLDQYSGDSPIPQGRNLSSLLNS